MAKEKSLSTKVIKLDIDIILKNFNKPEFWKKEWLIYKSNILELYARINNIDVLNNKINFEVFTKQEYFYCQKLKRKIHCYSYFARNFIIPINHSDYSKEKFFKDLISNSLSIIKAIEEKMIENYSDYINATNLENDYYEKLRDIANDFLDQNNVSNSDVREAYIDYYIDRCAIPDYTSDVLGNYRYTVIPHEYLMLVAFFGDKDKYDEYSEKCSKTRKSTKIKLWLDARKLENEDFIEEMRDLLEEI